MHRRLGKQDPQTIRLTAQPNAISPSMTPASFNTRQMVIRHGAGSFGISGTRSSAHGWSNDLCPARNMGEGMLVWRIFALRDRRQALPPEDPRRSHQAQVRELVTDRGSTWERKA